jgi:mannose-6-phosphate isomerase-like protein (cupin superfamily)
MMASARESSARFLALLDAVCDLYRRQALAGGPASALLETVHRRLAEIRRQPPSDVAPQTRPAARWLARALAGARSGPLGSLAAGLASLERDLCWLQNPNYSALSMGQTFDNYAYVELAGPGRRFDSADIRLGFLLLGPCSHYPDHRHPAEEVYHVVSGTAEWWREDTGWTEQRAGALIHHAPHIRHAVRTDEEPLLALYCWAGEIDTHATLTA